MGITTIIVSHDPGIAKQVDRVVAIRDGMLASETVRQVRSNGANGGDEGAAGHNGAAGSAAIHDTFEELVVLDRAGRVHVPQEYLEQYAIKGRARLELVDGGILIRAVEQRPPAGEKSKGADGDGMGGAADDPTAEGGAEGNAESAAPSAAPKPKGLRRLFGKK
jgi:hypothetical protein